MIPQAEQISWLDDMVQRRAVIEWGDVGPSDVVHKRFFRSPQGDIGVDVTAQGKSSFRIIYGEELVS